MEGYGAIKFDMGLGIIELNGTVGPVGSSAILLKKYKNVEHQLIKPN